MSEEEPKDVTGVEAILERHSVHKAEIDTRENTFKTFHDTSKLLISKGHFASKEVSLNVYKSLHFFVFDFVFEIISTLKL